LLCVFFSLFQFTWSIDPTPSNWFKTSSIIQGC